MDTCQEQHMLYYPDGEVSNEAVSATTSRTDMMSRGSVMSIGGGTGQKCEIIHADYWYVCLDVGAVLLIKSCFVICDLCVLVYIT